MPTQLPMEARTTDGSTYGEAYRVVAEYNTKGDGHFYLTTQDGGDSVNYRDRYSVAKAYFAAHADEADRIQMRPATGDIHTWLDEAKPGMYWMNAEGQENAPSTNWWYYIGQVHQAPPTSRYVHITANRLYQGSVITLVKRCEDNYWSDWQHIGDGCNAALLNGKTASEISTFQDSGVWTPSFSRVYPNRPGVIDNYNGRWIINGRFVHIKLYVELRIGNEFASFSVAGLPFVHKTGGFQSVFVTGYGDGQLAIAGDSSIDNNTMSVTLVNTQTGVIWSEVVYFYVNGIYEINI
jgi:hypothetical protein